MYLKLWHISLVISEENLLNIILGGSVNHSKNTHESIPGLQMVYKRWTYIYNWTNHGGWSFTGGHPFVPGSMDKLMRQLMNKTSRRGTRKFI